ncbi:uncharacterized protein [Diabrotica undecimpunctata]|uniref:uncharacterized protein n=1 Tax=Diabrotica undecimpunctata TaxID=50387 RepID=UPI003B6345B7
MALQETKQLGSEITDIEDMVLFKSGSKDRMLGTGFLVAKCIKDKVIAFNPISDRMCSIRIKSKKRSWSIINIHVPSEDKDDEIKDLYYEQLIDEYERLPKRNEKIIMGD